MFLQKKNSKKSSKGCNDIARNCDSEGNEREENGVFQDSENALIFEAVEDSSGSSF